MDDMPFTLSNQDYRILPPTRDTMYVPSAGQVIEISSDEEDDMTMPPRHTSAAIASVSSTATKVRSANHLDALPSSRLDIGDGNDEDNESIHTYTRTVPPAKRRKLSPQTSLRVENNRENITALKQSGHWAPEDTFNQSVQSLDGSVFDIDGFEIANPWSSWNFENLVEDNAVEELLFTQSLQAEETYQKLASRFNIGRLGKDSQLAPYYDDAKLGLRMYRGPGYEKFPIPLGKQAEHIAICQIWDNNQLKKWKKSCVAENSSEGQNLSSDYHGILDNQQQRQGEAEDPVSLRCLECLDEVVTVLPQISHRFALDLIRSMSWDGIDGSEQIPVSQDVLAAILDLEAYPQETSQTSDDEGESFKTISWSKESTNISEYQRDAVILLADEFTFVPTFHISRVVRQLNSLYDAYLTIQEYESKSQVQQSTTTKRPYPRLRQPRDVIEKKYARSSHAQRDQSQWIRLVSELQAAKQQYQRRHQQQQAQKDKKAAEDANLQAQIASGDIFECQCCFDDEVPRNRSVRCQGEEGHQYCYSCVERLAGSNTGSGKYEMCCMSLSGCKAELESTGISNAVPKRMLEKMAFYRQLADVAAANISGLEKCPHCDFQGICEPVEVDSVFSCLDPACGRMTCRLCLQPAHSPKTCEDVKREMGLINTRHMIEEARSQAMMRTCPKCHKKVIKEAGCNKMYCTCGGMLCFVCQKDITREGYKHFTQSGCPQHDGNFNRHNYDADQAEREAITKIRTDHPEYKEGELRIHAQSVPHVNNPAPRFVPPPPPRLPPPPPQTAATVVMNQLRRMVDEPYVHPLIGLQETPARGHMEAAAVLVSMYGQPPFPPAGWQPTLTEPRVYQPAAVYGMTTFGTALPPAIAGPSTNTARPTVTDASAAWTGVPQPGVVPATMVPRLGPQHWPPFSMPLDDLGHQQLS